MYVRMPASSFAPCEDSWGQLRVELITVCLSLYGYYTYSLTAGIKVSCCYVCHAFVAHALPQISHVRPPVRSKAAHDVRDVLFL